MLRDLVLRACSVCCVLHVVSLGTSGTIFARTPGAARDPTGAICPFLDATGGGLPLMCTLNCASVPEEVRAGYGLSRDEISALAEAEPIGCEGLTFLPYLVGERTPNWPHASGVIAGLRPGHLARPGLVYRAALGAHTPPAAGPSKPPSISTANESWDARHAVSVGRRVRHAATAPSPHDALDPLLRNVATAPSPRVCVRAEGVAFSLRDGLAAMAEHGLPEGCDEVRLVGGGSKSALWRQIIADALQMRVACPAEPESGALGAALQAAAVVSGAEQIGEWIEREHPAPVGEVVPPNRATEVVAAYEAAYQKYAERGRALFGDGA